MKAIPDRILIEFTEAERKTISQSIDLLEQLLNLLINNDYELVLDNDDCEVDCDDISNAQFTFKVLRDAVRIE